MTHVITASCIGVCDASCVAVCPVDCIHPTPEDMDFDQEEMLYINPETCIDCGLCVDECPVAAIFPEDELPDASVEYIQINADYFEKRSL